MITVVCGLYKSSLTSLPSFQDVFMSGFDIAKLIFSEVSKQYNEKEFKPSAVS